MPAQHPTFPQHLTELQHLLSIQLNLPKIEVTLQHLNLLLHEKVTSLYSIKRDIVRIFSLDDLPTLVTVYEEFTNLHGADSEIAALISIDIMILSDGLRMGRWCATENSVQKLVACRRCQMDTTLQNTVIEELDELVREAVACLHRDTVKLDKVLFFMMLIFIC